jgi:hypothetical protein
VRVAASLAVAKFEWQRAGMPGAAATNEMLSQANAAFGRIIETRKASELSRLVAKLGRAAVLENEGDIAGAKAIYDEVSKSEAAKNSGLATLASDSLTRLGGEVFAAAFPSKPAPTSAPATIRPSLPAELTDKAPDVSQGATDKQPPAGSAANIAAFAPTTQPAGEGE